MKYLRLSLTAGSITLALALSTFAGEMHTGFASPPPPATGGMETTRTVAATDFVDITGTEIVLSFMQNMLSLF